MSPLSISAAHTRPVHSQPYNLQLAGAKRACTFTTLDNSLTFDYSFNSVLQTRPALADALHIKEIRAGTQAEELLIEGMFPTSLPSYFNATLSCAVSATEYIQFVALSRVLCLQEKVSTLVFSSCGAK